MTSQEPRRLGKVIRDPVHDYVRVPNELLPLVRSPYIQRLRNISQNSRASSIYPSLNGSRYEHALGTMHLAVRAWRTAWANLWSDDGDSVGTVDIARQQFMNEVYEELKLHSAETNALGDPALDRFLAAGRGYQDFQNEFERLIEWTVAVVGLVHDVGHPPFSHVLEGTFEKHSGLVFGSASEMQTEFEQYTAQVEHGPAQFHEFAGHKIFEQMIADTTLFNLLPKALISMVFNARKGDDWKGCLHQLIDGQVDVDRLDYIVRDSLRAGTDNYAIDRERLLDSLELHKVVQDGQISWRIGLGIRGVSAMESLLLQRLQSYRWVIFHSQALLTDTCLERAVSFALSGETGVPVPDLNYVSAWSANPQDVPPSYKVDDHRIFEWLRRVRSTLSALREPDASSRRCMAYLRIADEMSSDYRAAWRTYGEFLDALEASAVVADLPGAKRDDGSTISGADLAQVVNALIKADALVDPLDVRIENRLNQSASEIDGVFGCWIVCERLKFRALKPAQDPLWDGQREVDFERLSPIAASLKQSEDMRPLLWAFFIPYDPTTARPRADQVAQLAIEHIVAELTTNRSIHLEGSVQ